MTNKIRGDVEIEIGGRKACVAMTLGVLAELEDEMGISDFGELGEKLSSPRPKQILALMRAILKGNGVKFEEIELKRLDVGNVSAWLSEIMSRSSFSAATEDGDAGEGKTLPLMAAE